MSRRLHQLKECYSPPELVDKFLVLALAPSPEEFDISTLSFSMKEYISTELTDSDLSELCHTPVFKDLNMSDGLKSVLQDILNAFPRTWDVCSDVVVFAGAFAYDLESAEKTDQSCPVLGGTLSLGNSPLTRRDEVGNADLDNLVYSVTSRINALSQYVTGRRRRLLGLHESGRRLHRILFDVDDATELAAANIAELLYPRPSSSEGRELRVKEEVIKTAVLTLFDIYSRQVRAYNLVHGFLVHARNSTQQEARPGVNPTAEAEQSTNELEDFLGVVGTFLSQQPPARRLASQTAWRFAPTPAKWRMLRHEQQLQLYTLVDDIARVRADLRACQDACQSLAQQVEYTLSVYNPDFFDLDGQPYLAFALARASFFCVRHCRTPIFAPAISNFANICFHGIVDASSEDIKRGAFLGRSGAVGTHMPVSTYRWSLDALENTCEEGIKAVYKISLGVPEPMEGMRLGLLSLYEELPDVEDESLCAHVSLGRAAYEMVGACVNEITSVAELGRFAGEVYKTAYDYWASPAYHDLTSQFENLALHETFLDGVLRTHTLTIDAPRTKYTVSPHMIRFFRLMQRAILKMVALVDFDVVRDQDEGQDRRDEGQDRRDEPWSQPRQTEKDIFHSSFFERREWKDIVDYASKVIATDLAAIKYPCLANYKQELRIDDDQPPVESVDKPVVEDKLVAEEKPMLQKDRAAAEPVPEVLRPGSEGQGLTGVKIDVRNEDQKEPDLRKYEDLGDEELRESKRLLEESFIRNRIPIRRASANKIPNEEPEAQEQATEHEGATESEGLSGPEAPAEREGGGEEEEGAEGESRRTSKVIPPYNWEPYAPSFKSQLVISSAEDGDGTTYQLKGNSISVESSDNDEI
ncbi:hypothetical protein GNI_004560 [Gregarina niphandrodes]|uniref:Uncharacterized protein n=1 Tax=Gregarina niphandrodes TaxID=110365 RepID=A0A023BDH0_GRENI|nr:hypothetical protein GNI_004560 [Gregarina niphandrodes]EZG88486.1 hypothetical protein GNI_004560 [Gregarina niphandrodes]|eukprot:XP_011128559.1 hypothetical protein GNI_004560 [Gregarina niphandrodes]